MRKLVGRMTSVARCRLAGPVVFVDDARVRVAAIYDIHGNLSALEAALAEIDASDADLFVVGGDVAWDRCRARRSSDSSRWARGRASSAATPTATCSSRWRPSLRTPTTPPRR